MIYDLTNYVIVIIGAVVLGLPAACVIGTLITIYVILRPKGPNYPRRLTHRLKDAAKQLPRLLVHLVLAFCVAHFVLTLLR